MEPAPIGTPDGAAFHHARYVTQPWGEWAEQLPDRRENVVLLGTGLTMVDAFLTLSALDWQGTIFAISRNGWLPQSHFRGIEYPDFPPQDPATLGLSGVVELVETHCVAIAKPGRQSGHSRR